jgi:hypothetical protein
VGEGPRGTADGRFAWWHAADHDLAGGGAPPSGGRRLPSPSRWRACRPGTGGAACRCWHYWLRSGWPLAGAGPDTSDSGAALLSRNGPDYDRFAVTELNADHTRRCGEYRIVLPDGQPLPSGTQVIGRGSRPHFRSSQKRMPDHPGTGCRDVAFRQRDMILPLASPGIL